MMLQTHMIPMLHIGINHMFYGVPYVYTADKVHMGVSRIMKVLLDHCLEVQFTFSRFYMYLYVIYFRNCTECLCFVHTSIATYFNDCHDFAS